jgi:uncharacterized protein YyaL (SSP411 family)
MTILLRGGALVAVGAALLQLASGLRTGAAHSVPRAAALPGAEPHPAALERRLRAALAAAPGPPRTRHRYPDGTAMFANRLLLEPSPYLQQHAHNPVDWYPWGDEAFARARAEGKPVLLSVGYSTCHWCHVMEEESFEDLAIAEYLNRHYVAIKVDRETRPDVDGVYMQAVQLMGERGGWPMTVWLTPERQPFYGGTYFPARDGDRGQRVGFLTLLQRLRAAFDERPAVVAAAAADLAQQIRASMAAPSADALPDRAAIERAVAALQAQYDSANGGFGRAPKFPRPVQLELLLRWARQSGDTAARDMVEHTLTAMAVGGIYDQIGGGFHRYATDAQWRVPHFEKMLYDNALLALAYLEAYQLTGRPDFAAVTRDVLAYVARDMTAPSGAFYAASDADSGGVEGAFFVWSAAEMEAVLSADQWRVASAYYALDTTTDEHDGSAILRAPQPLSAVAQRLAMEEADAAAALAGARAALLAARQRRVAPHTDRKILPGWNCLMISAFARAGFVLDEPASVQRAARAADYLLAHMTDGERLQRSALDGHASGGAYLDDYASCITAVLDLYEASFDPRWLRAALALEQVVDRHFRDDAAGGYFVSADDAETLLAREKPTYDGAEPSGTSTMVLALLRLSELTGDDRYRARADAALRAGAAALNDDPVAMPRLLSGLDFRLDRPQQIIIVTPSDVAEAEPFLARLRPLFLPNRVVAVASEGDTAALAELVPLVGDKVARGGRTTAYVCEERVCDLPTSDPEAFARQLE